MSRHYIAQNLSQCLPTPTTIMKSSIFVENAVGDFAKDLDLLDELDLSSHDRKFIKKEVVTLAATDNQYRAKRGDEVYYYNKEECKWYIFKARF